MAIRTNEVNNGGLVTVAGGSMIANTFTDAYGQTSQNQNGITGSSVITVTANAHPVERGGDLGLFDTTSGVAVAVDKCTFGPSANYPNV